MLIVILFGSAGDLFEGAFSLWVSLKFYLSIKKTKLTSAFTKREKESESNYRPDIFYLTCLENKGIWKIYLQEGITLALQI